MIFAYCRLFRGNFFEVISIVLGIQFIRKMALSLWLYFILNLEEISKLFDSHLSLGKVREQMIN
jgi:hypothetical protein